MDLNTKKLIKIHIFVNVCICLKYILNCCITTINFDDHLHLRTHMPLVSHVVQVNMQVVL